MSAGVGEAALEMGQVEETQPRQQERSADVGLEQEAEVVELVFPAGVGGPLRMGSDRRGWGWRPGARRRGTAGGGEALHADQRVGAHWS